MARNHETRRRNQGPVQDRWASDRDYRDRFAATHEAARRYERDREYEDRDRFVRHDERDRYPRERIPGVEAREVYGREPMRRARYEDRPYSPEPSWYRDEREREYDARDRFADPYEHERRLEHERRARPPEDDRYRPWPDDRLGHEYYRPDYDEYGRYIGDDIRARRPDLRGGMPARARDFAADNRDSGRHDYNPHRFGGYDDRRRELGRGGHDRDAQGRFIGDDEGFRGFDDDRDREVAGFGGYGRDDDRRYGRPPLRRGFR